MNKLTWKGKKDINICKQELESIKTVVQQRNVLDEGRQDERPARLMPQGMWKIYHIEIIYCSLIAMLEIGQSLRRMVIELI